MIAGGWVIVLVTAGSLEEARKLARSIVEERLAACATVVPNVESVYWWKERVEKSSEHLLILKTRAELLPRLVQRIKELHSYEVPEILVIPVLAGYAPYLSWLDESVKG